MSDSIDETRRKIIQLGMFAGVTLLVTRKLFADEITDLITQDNQNQIIAVRLWPSSIYTRLTIEAEYAILAKYELLDNPKRLVINIDNAQLNGVLQTLSNKVLEIDPIISSIKIAESASNTVQLSIFLKQNIQLQSKSIPPVSLDNVNYKYRYVLDMYPNETDGTDNGLNDDLLALLQQQSNTAKSSILAASSPNTSMTTVVNNPRALPHPEFRAVPKTSTKGKILIMLDPGHGGEDPGAIGPTGTKEKHVVLDIGKHLYDLINQTDYMAAKLTRSDDVFIPLGARVAIARRAKADIFVSIHADAFTTPEAKGSSVFMLSDRGASSSFARWLAKTQNNSDLIGGMSFKSKDRVVSKVLLDMTQTWTRNKSDKLGQILLANLGNIGKLHNGHVEKAAFAVLKAPDIPSVLVETAFISNPYEENLLKTADFRQKMALTIFAGVSKFAQDMLAG